MKDGPFFKELEKCLQDLSVQWQAYQGGTFVGNHVHKLLKVNTHSNDIPITHSDKLQKC